MRTVILNVGSRKQKDVFGRPNHVPKTIQGSISMPCPICGHNKSGVIDSRAHKTFIRRRRFCIKCEYRFTTYETIDPGEIIDFQI